MIECLIMNTLLKNLKSEHNKVYFVGSRVTGKNKKFRDFDIAIDGKDLTPGILLKIRGECGNSNFPYLVGLFE